MASSTASLLACSLPTSSSLLSSSSSSSSSSSVYYSPLASRSSAFFRHGRLVSRRVWGGARTAAPSPSAGALRCRCLFGLGVPELVVIAGVAALVFGPKKLPEIGRSIGKTVKSFQQAAKEFETELKKEPEQNEESPPAEKPTTVSSEGGREELEASGTKEST